MGNIADYDQASATQAALDFITGLKQFRGKDPMQNEIQDDIVESLVNDLDSKMTIEDKKEP